MTIIDKLQEEIRVAQEKIDRIREGCSHPPDVVEQVAKSNAGNYDPADDVYWYEYTCHLCGKKWTTPQ